MLVGQCASVVVKWLYFLGYLGAASDVQNMIKQAELQMPLLLVSGFGRVLGYWCITQCKETQTLFMPDSIPMKIAFSLSLLYFGLTDQAFDLLKAQISSTKDELARALL